jgi:YVTN family beta-propeller protein
MRTLFATLLLAAPVLAGTSNSLIDVSPDGKQLAVANTDTGTVSVVDLKGRKKLAEYKCGDHPEGVSWVADTGVFLATVYGDDRLMWYDAAKGHLASLKIDDEPYGVVVTKDGKFAYVSHDYPGTVSEIDVAAKKVLRSFKVGTGVRGIALGNDEKTIYVTEFFTANLIAVDRESGKVTDKWAGYESDNLARHVVLHPKREKAYISHTRAIVNVFDARGSIAPKLSIADLWTKPADEKRRRTIAVDTFNGVYVMCNPWEAALSPDGKRLYLVYAGTDDASVVKVLDDDYREIERFGRDLPKNTGKHPQAVRVSPDGKEVYIYNTLDYEVGIYDADLRRLAGVAVCPPAHTAEWRRGKELFETARAPVGSARWVACSSCHPSGLTDGRTWQNPEGNRKTPNLFGLAHTHPLHWSADRDEVQDFEFTMQGALMRGRGLLGSRLPAAKGFEPIALDHKLAGKSKDLDAMAVYTNSFKVRLSPHIPEPGKLFPEAERGKKLFFGKETNCASCHTGPYFTDNKKDPPFVTHDVGTGTGDKREKMGPKYDTPTLLGVYRIHAYLHDGRAATLHDVLTTHNKGDKHGKTSHLRKEELDDLVAFLKSLPYETPPDVTPNTVKDYLKDMVIPRPDEK